MEPMDHVSFVEKCENDLIVGLLWFRIEQYFKESKSELIYTNDKFWIGKTRHEWFRDLGITPKQFDRALTILIKNGVVEKRVFQLYGAPIVHVHLKEQKNIKRMKDMATIKVRKSENQYIQIKKELIDDDCISWNAKGAYAFLLTFPENEQMTIENIMKHCKNDVDSVLLGIKELIDHGYLK